MPGAGPFYFEGNDVGILLLHGGGGGTAADLKPMAEFLHNEGGYTVRVPLLTGFGTSPEDLKETKISDWMNDLDVEFNFMTQKVKKVIVGGHSFGGVLTLYLGATKNPDGIFTISAPFGVQKFLRRILSNIRHLGGYMPLQKEEAERETDGAWVGYDKYPMTTGIRIIRMKNKFIKYHPQITCPALLIQGRLDSQIQPSSMEKIYNLISSENKKKLWLENSDHSILKMADEELLFTEILNFIKEVIK